jgi:hypothetical protein
MGLSVIEVSQIRRVPAEDRSGPSRHNIIAALFKPYCGAPPHGPHPEVLGAKRRASKDAGPGASACILRGPRCARAPQDEEHRASVSVLAMRFFASEVCGTARAKKTPSV